MVCVLFLSNRIITTTTITPELVTIDDELTNTTTTTTTATVGNRNVDGSCITTNFTTSPIITSNSAVIMMMIKAFLNWAETLYEQMFIFDEDKEHSTLRRVMAYWVAAMSLVRALLVLMPCCELFYAVGVMYVLETLAFTYESGMRTVCKQKARIVCYVSIGFSLAAFWAGSTVVSDRSYYYDDYYYHQDAAKK